MKEFFELRTYKIYSGKMEEWVNFMEKIIIPFQISKGMVINGSFTVEGDDETYVWIRRFNSKEDKEKLYIEVYDSDKWKNEIAPIVSKLIDREAIKVVNLKSTRLSVIK